MRRSSWLFLLMVAGMSAVQMTLLPAADAGGETGGSITCGTNGHAAYTIRFARNHGLLTTSQGPGPTSADGIAAKIKPATIGDPDAANSLGLPEVGIWTFAGNLANINFGASQATSGGSYNPQYDAHQCTKQAAPTGTVTKSYTNAHVSCPVGQRVVVWSDGWGNHWVSYRSTDGGALKRVKMMWSNYGTLRMGSAYIDEREVFDVRLFATTSKPKSEWPDDFMPGHAIRCNTDGYDPKLQ